MEKIFLGNWFKADFKVCIDKLGIMYIHMYICVNLVIKRISKNGSNG